MSSDLSIHYNLDLLKQAPEYLSTVNSELRNASQSMRDYFTALAGTGYLSRTNDYTTSYNNILTNIGTNTNTLVGIRSDIESDITQINNFNPDLTADAAAIAEAAAELDAANNQEELEAATAASTTGEVSEENDFWDSWFGKALTAVGHFFEDVAATIVGLITSLFEAVANLLEDVVDLLVTVGVAVASFVCSAINVIFGTDIPVEKWENWCKCFVAHDFSGSVFSALYNNTGFGQWIAENDFAHQLGIHDVVVDSLEWVGIAVLGAFTGGAAAAALGAAKGFGSTAEKAYANGSSFWGGVAGATVMGVIDGFIGYGIGTAANTIATSMKGGYTQIFTKDGIRYFGYKDGVFTYANEQGVLDYIAAQSGAIIPYNPAALVTTGGAQSIFTQFGLAKVLGGTAIGAGLLGILDPSKSGGVIDTNNPFHVDYDLYDENGQYNGFHDGQHLKHQGDPNDPNATPTDDGDDDEDDKKPYDEEGDDKKPTDEKDEKDEENDTPEEETPLPGDDTPSEPTGGSTGGGGTTLPVEDDPATETPLETVQTSTDGGKTDPTYEPEPTTPVEETPVEETPVDDEPADETPLEDEPADETPLEDEPKEDIPTLAPDTEDEWPEITVTNVGPKEVVLSSGTGTTGGGIRGGNTSIPEFSNPEEPLVEEPAEPLYNWESASPTIEAPDMTAMDAEEAVKQVATKQIEVQAVETTGSATLADVNSIENLNNSYTAPGFDTSMLGMGTTVLGVGGATAYGAVKSKEEDEDKKESVSTFTKEVKEETKKVEDFNQQ